tara:strand:- start:4128 stop:4325 length:198 start_codon:yes stop_codon:yes gene_type:complete
VNIYLFGEAIKTPSNQAFWGLNEDLDLLPRIKQTYTYYMILRPANAGLFYFLSLASILPFSRSPC